MTTVGDDMPRPTRLAVLLAVALAALALSSSSSSALASDVPPSLAKAGDAALANQARLPYAFATRLAGDDRGGGVTERSKQRLLVLVVVAALLAIVASARRWSLLSRASGFARASLWSPQSGRAPPSLQLLRI